MKLPSRDLDEAAARVMNNGGEALRGRSILLTGGTGFIGRWIIESFCRLNVAHDLRARMAILTRDPDRFRTSASHLAADPALTVVKGDLRALALGQSSPAPQQCDAVVHGATETSETLARNPRAFLATIEATRDALEFAVRTSARRFLYLSSGMVYGRQPRDLCASYAKQFGLEVVIARGFAFIGPHLPLDRNFAAGNFLRDALNEAPIQIRGDGTALRSYLYAADLASWLWVLLLRGAPGRAYNVGSEDAVSIAELARETAGLVHPPLPVTIAGVPDPGRAPERYVPSTARARSELALEETVGWRTALRKTYEWHRESRMAEAPARSAG